MHFILFYCRRYTKQAILNAQLPHQSFMWEGGAYEAGLVKRCPSIKDNQNLQEFYLLELLEVIDSCKCWSTFYIPNSIHSSSSLETWSLHYSEKTKHKEEALSCSITRHFKLSKAGLLSTACQSKKWNCFLKCHCKSINFLRFNF